jgi:shikimate dehydrogenase-like protein
VASPDERFLVGLIGADIGTSMSPALHEREADRHGLRYLYEVVDLTTLRLAAADVGELVTAAQRLAFRGLNITHPCKQEVLKYLDDLSPEAAELGAVNTVVFDRGRSTGYNTDGTASRPASLVRCPACPPRGSCCSAPVARARPWPPRWRAPAPGTSPWSTWTSTGPGGSRRR